jgi:hypothetical protein
MDCNAKMRPGVECPADAAFFRKWWQKLTQVKTAY